MKALKWVLAGAALVVFSGSRSEAALHTINVSNFSFGPNNLLIMQNDEVKWQRVNGSHTTTSGPPGSPNGTWNQSINLSSPSYTRTFGQVGTFPYYCAFHYSSYSMTGQIRVEAAMGIFDDPETDNALPFLALRQNTPNPFNAATQIEFSVDRDGYAQLAVYNILGQKVRILVDGFQPGGLHTVTWDGRDDHGNETPSGIYFARLTTVGVMMTRKMVLLR